MNQFEWIVCERNNRWAVALRTAIARRSLKMPLPILVRDRERLSVTSFAPPNELPPRLREVRSLAELTQQFDARPCSFALVEVGTANLGSVLSWLADARCRYPGARFAAILDSSLMSPATNRQDVVDALMEAGAGEIAVSPRQLQQVLALANQHWADWAMQNASAPSELSLVEWARSQLPWQDS